MPLVTISIATKDRPEVVDSTLRKLHAFGLGQCPLILLDDGSIPRIRPPAINLFPQSRLLRNEIAQGQALGRNLIARECSTPFLLQLDDDSYPVEGDLEELLNAAMQAKNWLAIALPFEEPARNRRFPTELSSHDAIKVRAFVGCSALIQVKHFNSLGGYANWIGRTGEEDELCIRAFSKGYSVVTFDGLRIRHEVTTVDRQPEGILYRSFCNCTLLWALNAPLVVLPYHMLRLVLAAVRSIWRDRSFGSLKGLAAGWRQIPKLKKRRAPLTLSAYREFIALPHVLSFFETSSRLRGKRS
jgi:GT2 family glycosyltransferase